MQETWVIWILERTDDSAAASMIHVRESVIHVRNPSILFMETVKGLVVCDRDSWVAINVRESPYQTISFFDSIAKHLHVGLQFFNVAVVFVFLFSLHDAFLLTYQLLLSCVWMLTTGGWLLCCLTCFFLSERQDESNAGITCVISLQAI